MGGLKDLPFCVQIDFDKIYFAQYVFVDTYTPGWYIDTNPNIGGRGI